MDFKYKISDEQKELFEKLCKEDVSITDLQKSFYEKMDEKRQEDIYIAISGSSGLKPTGFIGFDEGKDEKWDKPIVIYCDECASISADTFKKMVDTIKNELNTKFEIITSLPPLEMPTCEDLIREANDFIKQVTLDKPDKKVTPANYVHPNQKSKRRNYKCLKK